MALAVVRTLESPRRLTSPQELDDFEQELVDQYALAGAAAGVSDGTVAKERSVVVAFIRFTGGRAWEVTTADADRYLTHQRRVVGLSGGTVHAKALMMARFYEFLIDRYQGEIYALTGCVVEQVIDAFNRPVKPRYGAGERVPPKDAEVEELFGQWREWLPQARKYLPAARDYLAASLWRRVGLRISESAKLDIRDWRVDLGERGKLHVRHGKGSRGRGPKPRLVPAINEVDALMDWWLGDVRHQFGDDYSDPDAPLLPSERWDRELGRCGRVGTESLRCGLADTVARWLPAWNRRLTPHVLRHYCASSLYGHGMDLKAIQELLGHQWLSTTTRYVHVHDAHIEQAWAAANDRVAARFSDDDMR
jgi:site-specific recombinase XerD